MLGGGKKEGEESMAIFRATSRFSVEIAHDIVVES